MEQDGQARLGMRYVLTKRDGYSPSSSEDIRINQAEERGRRMAG